MHWLHSLCVAILCGAIAVQAALSSDWRSKTIYQVLTDRFGRSDDSVTASCNTEDRKYCGGTYQGIINRLDYIQNMGFTAVWISPVTYNIEGSTGHGEAYHGFWQQDIYALNPHFGTADDLRALSKALHDRGMYLMVDVVTNHFGWPGGADSVDYSKFNPFNSRDYFHPYCAVLNDGNQDNQEDCWLGDSTVALVDVKTEDEQIVGMYSNWISQLISNYSIDGIRIDTVKHVDKAFWTDFNTASGVFSLGEVFNGDPVYTCPYQDIMSGVLNFPIYFPLRRAFESTSGSMSNLASMIDRMKNECRDPSIMGTFSENHDLPRFGSVTQDLALAKNVIAYTLLADGIPIIYSGQEHLYRGGEDPGNREAVWLSGYFNEAPLYKIIAAFNQVRNRAIFIDPNYVTYRNWVIYSDTTTVVMRKGYDNNQVITVLTNKGANGDAYTMNLGNHGWGSGTVVIDALTCSTLTVDGSGNLQVPMAQGEPRVYIQENQVRGSGICGR